LTVNDTPRWYAIDSPDAGFQRRIEETLRASILVVDDDDGTRGVVALALRRAGFDVVEASSGEGALDALQTATIHLVVMDISMPGMSGIDAVRLLRSSSETATLPVVLMTGSGDGDSVIAGLEAGADDFLPKPVRLDELVARVTAHLRTQAAWSDLVEDELRSRSSVVASLTRLPISPVPDEAAEAVVRELATRTDSDVVAVLQVGVAGQLHELATYERSTGVRRGGTTLPPSEAARLLTHARKGPWIEGADGLRSVSRASTGTGATTLAAGAPIYSGADLVGVLTIGMADETGASPPVRRAMFLAAAIDFANVLSMRAGVAFADRRDVAAIRARLREDLTAGRFHPVFQPIVSLASRTTVGFEALTRFDDGVSPDIRFAEAAGVGLGPDFEIATIRAALENAPGLPEDAFLSINVSPEFVLAGDGRFLALVKASKRQLVLELTEHVPIDDYQLVRDAIAALVDVRLAVDDAGAGYASFRHIIELRPTYAKLDISLVRGIDADDLRQALAAGLQYFADRSGCGLIAEGVESAAEADALQRMGIAFGQGFLFGRPEPAA
jgi:EAL domain-containing protein (putative c-di-GMP-specific phosphodiesterase class I)/DNA-binding response OmpR family regulator